jgi:hypothetical protein
LGRHGSQYGPSGETLGRKTVRPGKKQTVSVTTLPAARVRIVVTFPDGGKKRQAGVAKDDGTYSSSFKQPKGQTTTSNRTARVVLTVSDEAGNSTQPHG